MKRIATLMAAIAMLAATSVASAAGNLWFTLISSSDATITATNSGPGQSLDLNKPLPGPATVRIGVNFSADTGTLAGYEIALASSLGGLLANGTASGSNYNQVLGDIGAASPSAVFGRGSGNNAGTVGLVYSFDLILAGPVPVYVTGDFGPSGVYEGTTFWQGSVGANPFSFGGPGYTGGQDTTAGWGDLPVITVTPEPTTLVLLGLGAVALLRRRK